MGKTTRWLGEGEAFSFPSSFGFTGSATGNVNPRQHPTQSDDEFGDDTYLSRMSAAPPALAKGGKVPPKGKMGKVPAPKAAKAVIGALQIGKMIGQRAADAGPKPPAVMPPMPAAAPGGAPPPMLGGMPGMRRGGEVAMDDDDGAPLHPPGTRPGFVDTVPSRGRSDEATQSRRYRHETGAESKMPDRGSDTGAQFAKGGRFIQKAISKPGALRRDLGVPSGEKIPEAKLRAAAAKPGKVGQRARFAETLRGFNHKKD